MTMPGTPGCTHLTQCHAALPQLPGYVRAYLPACSKTLAVAHSTHNAPNDACPKPASYCQCVFQILSTRPNLPLSIERLYCIALRQQVEVCASLATAPLLLLHLLPQREDGECLPDRIPLLNRREQRAPHLKHAASSGIFSSLHSPSVLQAHPIHLWDACTGGLRCVYRAFDAADEVTAAFSLTIDPHGSHIWAGYNKTIRVFDLSRPGRDCQTITTAQKGQDGLPGATCHVSCINVARHSELAAST